MIPLALLNAACICTLEAGISISPACFWRALVWLAYAFSRCSSSNAPWVHALMGLLGPRRHVDNLQALHTPMAPF